MFNPISRKLIVYGCLGTAFVGAATIWRVLQHQTVGIRGSPVLILVCLLGPSLGILEGLFWIVEKKATDYEPLSSYQKGAFTYTRYKKSEVAGRKAVRMGTAQIVLCLIPLLLLLLGYLVAPPAPPG